MVYTTRRRIYSRSQRFRRMATIPAPILDADYSFRLLRSTMFISTRQSTKTLLYSVSHLLPLFNEMERSFFTISAQQLSHTMWSYRDETISAWLKYDRTLSMLLNFISDQRTLQVLHTLDDNISTCIAIILKLKATRPYSRLMGNLALRRLRISNAQSWPLSSTPAIQLTSRNQLETLFSYYHLSM